MYLLVRLARRLKIPVCTTTTSDLTQRNLRDTSLNSSLRQFSPRPPHEGDFDFLRYFWGFLSRFGRGVATWDWSNLTEPHLSCLLADARPFSVPAVGRRSLERVGLDPGVGSAGRGVGHFYVHIVTTSSGFQRQGFVSVTWRCLGHRAVAPEVLRTNQSGAYGQVSFDDLGLKPTRAQPITEQRLPIFKTASAKERTDENGQN